MERPEPQEPLEALEEGVAGALRETGGSPPQSTDADCKLDNSSAASSSPCSEEARQQLENEARLFMEGVATFRQRCGRRRAGSGTVALWLVVSAAEGAYAQH